MPSLSSWLARGTYARASKRMRPSDARSTAPTRSSSSSTARASERGIANRTGNDPGGAVIALAGTRLESGVLLENSLHFFSGKTGQNRNPRSCLLFSRNRELAHGNVYISAARQLNERLERKAVGQQHANQRPKQPCDGRGKDLVH